MFLSDYTVNIETDRIQPTSQKWISYSPGLAVLPGCIGTYGSLYASVHVVIYVFVMYCVNYSSQASKKYFLSMKCCTQNIGHHQ